MKRIVLVLFIVITASLNAQTVRTDTVKPGYYIPFDSNFVSCKVAIMPKGKKVEFTNTTGNKIPDSLVAKIGNLEAGSVVTYSEVTILRAGVFTKSNSVRYVIGSRNSVYARRDPSQPDTLSAAEIGSLVLDKQVYSFDVSFLIDGAYYVYSLTGNGVCCDARERILTLKSGTKVWVDNIKRQEDDGSKRVAPVQIYIVK